MMWGPNTSHCPLAQISKTEATAIGRSRQNNICILQDEMVSRKHGKIIPQPRAFMLQDLGSINGTFINQVRLSSQRTALCYSCAALCVCCCYVLQRPARPDSDTTGAWQNQVATEQTVLLRLGDEVEMGNSIFRVDLVVPNPLEDDEATTAIDDDEIAMLKDEDMGVLVHHEVHDAEEEEEEDEDDDDEDLDVGDEEEEAHLAVDEAEGDEAIDHVLAPSRSLP